MLRRRILYRKKQIVDYNPDYSADNLVFTGSNYVDTGIKLCDYKKDWIQSIYIREFVARMLSNNNWNERKILERNNTPSSDLSISFDRCSDYTINK